MNQKILFVPALISILLLSSCATKKVEKPAEEIKVQVVTPIQKNIDDFYQATGEMQALESIDAGSEITGKLVKLFVDEGSRVKKGMQLAQIDDQTQKTQLAQAEANLAKLKADWAKTLAGARPQELLTSEQSLFEAHSNFELATTDFVRIKNMYEQGVATKQELDSAANQMRVKKAAMQRAEESLSMTKEGPRKEDRDATYANLQMAQSQVDYAKTQMEKTRVMSSIDGVVTARYKQQGDIVTGQPVTNIFRVEKVDPIKAVLKIPQEDYNKIKLNQPMTITLSDGSKYNGKVSLIAPAIDVNNRAVKIEALIPNSDGKLKPGLFINGAILLQTKLNTMTVPLNVVQQSSGDTTSKVFVVKDNAARLVTVLTGIREDSTVEIISGITPQDQIISSGFDKIAEGTKVIISK